MPTLPLSLAAVLLLSPAPQNAQVDPEHPWKIHITSPTEPGIPMVVTGRLVDQDGKPLPNVEVFVYHTDANGLYRLPGQEGHRLKGTMWTSREGRFEFRTIHPGPYPGSKSGEHFHLEIKGGGLPDSFGGIEFHGDKVVVYAGKKGGSATYHESTAWKPDPEINGQRLDVELKLTR
jgi:protocatechuate 3,4-dioxygenase beta subunit